MNVLHAAVDSPSFFKVTCSPLCCQIQSANACYLNYFVIISEKVSG